MNRPFSKWLVIGLGLIVVLLLVNAGIAYRNTRQLHTDAYWVAHTHEVLESLDDLLSTVKDAETGQRGFLITGKENYLKPYEDALAATDRNVERVKGLTEDNDRQQARIPRLQELIRAKLDELSRTIALRKGPGFEAAQKVVLTDFGKNRMDEIRGIMAEVQQDEQTLLRDRQEANDRAYRSAIASGALAVLMGLVAVAGFTWVLRSHLTARQKAAAVLYEQREWYRTTLASVGDAVMTTDTENRITYLNAVAESLTGWRNRDAAGQPLDAVFHIINEQTRQPVENPAKRALKEGVIVGLANHTVLIANDGTERTIDDSAAPIRDAEGRVAGCVLIFRDISERRRLEQQNAKQGADAQNIVDTVREPLLILDTTLRVRSANRAFYQTFHVSSAETENRLIYELGNGQWDIPDLRTLLEDIVPKSSVFDDFELEHTFPVIGRRVMLLNARKLQAC
jgi:PAS domain S-box-containing protein